MAEAALENSIHFGKRECGDHFRDGWGYSEKAGGSAVGAQTVPHEHECSASELHRRSARKAALPHRLSRGPTWMLPNRFPPGKVCEFHFDEAYAA